MSVIDDALSAILKGSNPQSSDDDIAAQVAALKKSGGDAVDQALSFIPGLKTMKDVASNAPALATEAAKTPMGASITSALSGGPIAPNIPNPGNPISDISQGIVAGLANQPSAPTPPAAPQPNMPAPAPDAATPPATPDASAPDDTDDDSAPATPDLSALTAPASNDNAIRQQALAKATQQRKLATIPAAIAGVGDAIASGAKAFGVNAPTDVQGKVLDRAKADFDENKQQTDENLKNDPNSDISKAYRQMVMQIVPDAAKQPSFQSMSAAAIGDKLPLIDTMMKAQAAKDSKELGLQQIQSNKDVSIGLRNDQNQEKMEQQAKQMVANLRGDKSLARAEEQRDGAISVATTANQLQKEGRAPSKLEYYDLLGQLWKARTGATPTDAAIRDLDTSTFKGDFNKAASYITGKPAGATTSAILQNIKDFADQSGKLADQFHQGYMNAHLIKPQDLDESRWKPIADTGRGVSYADAMKLLKTQPAQNTSNKDSLGIL